jgi:hypothetical protein
MALDIGEQQRRRSSQHHPAHTCLARRATAPAAVVLRDIPGDTQRATRPVSTQRT